MKTLAGICKLISKRTVPSLPFICVVLFALYGCGKDENGGGDPSQPLIFSALVAEQDTIEPGGQTEISAIASGYRIEYYWSASAGDILKEGPEVIYVAQPCQTGINTITCTVKDGNGLSESREIIIVVQ